MTAASGTEHGEALGRRCGVLWRMDYTALAGSSRLAPSAAERVDALSAVASRWPDQPSTMLRLAAIAHGLGAGLDDLLATSRRQLREWSTRERWAPAADDAPTLRLAILVLLEDVEYATVIHSTNIPMALRDALTEPEDVATVAAAVRWESMRRRQVDTPDLRLHSWRVHVASIARDRTGWDEAEYRNTLDIRGHLQRDVALLSWTGQAQWRALIEPVDDAFRACTERQDVPLLLTHAKEPAGWWNFRVPVGAPPEFVNGRPDPRWHVQGHGPGTLSGLSHVHQLAERPDGLRALTPRELDAWEPICARQAAFELRDARMSRHWRDHHRDVLAERRRRAG